ENNRMETTFEVTSQGVIKFTPLGMTTKYLEHFILMQFTGLKDKNGKEIFEGDILKYENRNYEVSWMEDDGGFFAWLYGYSIQGGLFLWTEVIGNIYENPELLK
ncbi:hypothetical protein LCGC14_1961420, partial [marine sediment metagenome]